MERSVRATRKALNGDIAALCNQEAEWSPRLKSQAIRDIESGRHTYYVPWQSGRTEIRVVTDPSRGGGKYLRTDRDDKGPNNLLELPDC